MLELRRLAASYRRRAEGTHFVQVHLADIEVEDDTEAASTVSSCSVCHRQQPPIAPPPKSHDSDALPTKSHDPIAPITKPHIRTPPIKSHDAKAPPTGSHDLHDDTESNSSVPASNTHQDTESLTGQDLPHDEASVDEESDQDEQQGRLPTPELKQMPPARKIRHHLDRTTPCKGAILTSPPKEVRHGWNPEEEDEEDPLIEPTIPPGVTKVLPRYRQDMTSRAPIYPSHITYTANQQEKQPNFVTRKKPGVTSNRKTVTKQQRNLHKTQTQVSSRKAASTTSRKVKGTENDVECSFCGSPLRQPTGATYKGTRLLTDNRPLAMHKIGTAQPATATMNVPQQLRKTHLPQHLSQQQPLSGSLLSLSSCSVASEVLQRAQHRKATFWNQMETTAT